MAASIVQLHEIRKTYQMGLVTVEALRGVSIDICAAEYVSIMGPSGCGKSTLLNLLGCLDRPSSGRYVLGSEDISLLDDNALSSVRGTRLGFIFQSYNLIQQLTVVENIEVPLYYQGWPEAESRNLAKGVATRVGLADRLDHRAVMRLRRRDRDHAARGDHQPPAAGLGDGNRQGDQQYAGRGIDHPRRDTGHDGGVDEASQLGQCQ